MTARKTTTRLIIISGLVWLLTFAIAYAGAGIKNFSLEPGFNRVTVKWEAENEIDVKGYEVQRGVNEHDFTKLAFVDAKDEALPVKKYEYVDNTVFKTNSNGRTFYYRLKITNNDGSFNYSKPEHVTPTISSARQTWGMIKAMFR